MKIVIIARRIAEWKNKGESVKYHMEPFVMFKIPRLSATAYHMKFCCTISKSIEVYEGVSQFSQVKFVNCNQIIGHVAAQNCLAKFHMIEI